MDGYAGMDAIDDNFDVTRWPKWLRRTFVLALPVSVPLYLAVFITAIFASIAWWCVAAIVKAWK